VRDGRSITADQAVELGVVDLIARDVNVLLEEIDGQTVIMADGRQLIMDTAGGGAETYDPGFFRSLLLIIADPNLAFLFVSLGTLAVIYEVANPGLGLAGIIGVILLILGFFALSVLPITVAGGALLILAAGLFIGELFVPGIGVLAAGGTLSLIVGGLLLFEGPFGIRPIVLWPVGLVMGVGAMLAGRLTWQARRAPPASGATALVGRKTVVATGGGRTGQAFIEGAWWQIRSRTGDLIEGRPVTVVANEGLELIVQTEEDNP
jgi:membrane-bound serine protease (ClpP class)